MLLGVGTVDDVLKTQHVLQKINSKQEGTQEKKDKEKFYNKKLKEIRKFKKSKTKSTESEEAWRSEDVCKRLQFALIKVNKIFIANFIPNHWYS